MIIGFNQERVEFQDIYKQVPLSVDDDVNAASFKPAHDALIHVSRKRIRHGSGDDKQVPALKPVQLRVQCLYVLFRDVRPLSVDFRLLI